MQRFVLVTRPVPVPHGRWMIRAPSGVHVSLPICVYSVLISQRALFGAFLAGTFMYYPPLAEKNQQNLPTAFELSSFVAWPPMIAFRSHRFLFMVYDRTTRCSFGRRPSPCGAASGRKLTALRHLLTALLILW